MQGWWTTAAATWPAVACADGKDGGGAPDVALGGDDAGQGQQSPDVGSAQLKLLEGRTAGWAQSFSLRRRTCIRAVLSPITTAAALMRMIG